MAAIWRGFGETRPFRQAPGLYLAAQDWDENDLSAISAADSEATGALIGVIALLMMTYSDGWLISADGSDRIEFWEGNFFFHSDDAIQLSRAESIISALGCRRWTS